MSSYRKRKPRQRSRHDHYDRSANDFSQRRDYIFSCEASIHKDLGNDVKHNLVQQKQHKENYVSKDNLLDIATQRVVCIRPLGRSQSAGGFSCRRSNVLEDTRDSYSGLAVVGRNRGHFWPDAKVKQKTIDVISNERANGVVNMAKGGFRRSCSRNKGMVTGGNIMQTTQNIFAVTKNRCFPTCESDNVISNAVSNDAVRSDAVRGDAVRSNAVRSDAARSDVVRSDAVRSDAVRSDAVRSDAVRSDAVRSDVVRSDNARSDAIISYVVGRAAAGRDAAKRDAVGRDAGRIDAVGRDAIERYGTIIDAVGSNDARSEVAKGDTVRVGVVGRGAFSPDRRTFARSGAARSDASSGRTHERPGRKILMGRSQSAAGSRDRWSSDVAKREPKHRDEACPVQNRSRESVKSVVVRVELGN